MTRESYWLANGAHSNGQRIKIKDLDKTHLNNIIVMMVSEGRDRLMRSTMFVLCDEAIRRGMNLTNMKYLPYISHTTGELIEDGRY